MQERTIQEQLQKPENLTRKMKKKWTQRFDSVVIFFLEDNIFICEYDFLLVWGYLIERIHV